MKASKKIRIGLSILLIVLLLGCRSRNITKDYSFDDAKGKGVIIASLTLSGESGFAMRVNLRGLDSDFTDEIPITGFNVSSDFWKEPVSGNIPDYMPCGRLTIIELPQGEYEFYYLHGKKGHYRWWWRQRVSNPFKVIAGKAVYLGNIHIRIQSKGKWTTKQYYARGTISDMRERDLPLLYQ